MLEFQTVSVDKLCGCVSVILPSHLAYRYERKPNPDLTKQLLESGKGKRIVLANCPKCHGRGIDPDKE